MRMSDSLVRLLYIARAGVIYSQRALNLAIM